ncbi:MAG: hypothetical protein LUP99_05960 [Methanomicrobiales archaeon]|nr:hypothetical protein [Methanomicrobiales archaeon]
MGKRLTLHYKFNLKIQAAYGIFGFLVSLVILFLTISEVRVLAALAIGISNFLISGFYTDYYRNN